MNMTFVSFLPHLSNAWIPNKIHWLDIFAPVTLPVLCFSSLVGIASSVHFSRSPTAWHFLFPVWLPGEWGTWIGIIVHHMKSVTSWQWKILMKIGHGIAALSIVLLFWAHVITIVISLVHLAFIIHRCIPSLEIRLSVSVLGIWIWGCFSWQIVVGIWEVSGMRVQITDWGMVIHHWLTCPWTNIHIVVRGPTSFSFILSKRNLGSVQLSEVPTPTWEFLLPSLYNKYK